MINAKEEFLVLAKVKGRVIKCANIIIECEGQKSIKSILKVGYSESDYESFLESIDYEYDDGFGAQELYGVIWLEDGTWLDRWEYDGSEGWKHNIMPPIIDECK